MSVASDMAERGSVPAIRMTPAELVALVDAAIRSRKPASYLTGVRASFQTLGRSYDADATHLLAVLFQDCEIEMVLSLRAEWNRVAQRQRMAR